MTRVVATLATVVALTGPAAAAPPPVVSWEDAGDSVGKIVTVEGTVTAVQETGDTHVLEFGSGDARAFRVVLLLPMLSASPGDPAERYGGRRVRATGRVQRFRGRPEMVLRSAGQLEVVEGDLAAPPPAPVVPPAAATPPSAPPPTTPQGSLPPVAPPTHDAPATVTSPKTEVTACDQARARWREAASIARTRAASLGRCLAETTYRCRAASAALAPTLTALESAEQEVEQTCRASGRVE